MKKRIISLLLAAMLAMATLAVPAFAADEKVLTFGCQMYSDGLINPAAQTNTGWNCMRFGVGEALFKFNDNMEIEPWLAESYEANEDSTVWTIKLREGIKFSNGTDMTATKVKESLDWVREQGPNGSANPQKFLAFEAEVVADDAANTITITLPQADYNLPGNLSHHGDHQRLRDHRFRRRHHRHRPLHGGIPRRPGGLHHGEEPLLLGRRGAL